MGIPHIPWQNTSQIYVLCRTPAVLPNAGYSGARWKQMRIFVYPLRTCHQLSSFLCWRILAVNSSDTIGTRRLQFLSRSVSCRLRQRIIINIRVHHPSQIAQLLQLFRFLTQRQSAQRGCFFTSLWTPGYGSNAQVMINSETEWQRLLPGKTR